MQGRLCLLAPKLLCPLLPLGRALEKALQNTFLGRLVRACFCGGLYWTTGGRYWAFCTPCALSWEASVARLRFLMAWCCWLMFSWVMQSLTNSLNVVQFSHTRSWFRLHASLDHQVPQKIWRSIQDGAVPNSSLLVHRRREAILTITMIRYSICNKWDKPWVRECTLQDLPVINQK